MHKFIYLFWGLFCFGILACGSAKQPEKGSPTAAAAVAAPAKAEVGKVVPSESIAGSASTYAYYLPKSYDPAKPVALVVFYDSHARGKDPVTRYQGLADQYQVLLVGSNVSRNGQQPAQSLQIHDELMRDLNTKFKVDAQRITACGFSGGARVAAMLAQSRPDVGNVIACSAGFQPRQGDTFGYYAIVGLEDFNYQELRQLERTMDQGKQPHIIHYWNGPHEWPPVEVMTDALEFVKFRNLKADSPGYETEVQALLDRFAAEKVAPPMATIQNWRRYKALVAKLGGSKDLATQQAELDRLRASKEWAADQAAEEKEAAREMAARQQYVPLLGTKSVDEWRGLTNTLRAAHGPNQLAQHQTDLRVLNFLSLNTYFQVDGALKAGDLAATEHFLQIYALVDPTNPEHAYLTAVVRMRQGRSDDAIASLKAAQQIGFQDAGRLATDPEFAALGNNPAFVELLQAIGAGE